MNSTIVRKNARLAGIVVTLMLPVVALAHCDGLDGPVVNAARNALETGNVNFALVWVQQKDEPEVRNAFEKTLSVRKLSPTARELADMYFFETVVRIHRAGEGAPYTGLKPAGRNIGPAIPAADKSLATGSVEPLAKLLTDSVHDGLRARFHDAITAANYAKKDVEAGRRFVRAYVDFIHYAERVYTAATAQPAGHLHEGGGSAVDNDHR